MHRSEERQQPELNRRDDDQEAPRHQQIQWGKQMTGRDATPETILTLFEREGHAFSARNLATSVHRVGKLGEHRVRSDRRLPPLAEKCRRRIDAFAPQELANTAWGFAKTDFIERVLFIAIAVEALKRLGDFNSQNLANTVWAFAKADVAAEALFKAIAAAALRCIGEFKAQEMANTVWAFATADVVAQTLFKAIAKEALKQIVDFEDE